MPGTGGRLVAGADDEGCCGIAGLAVAVEGTTLGLGERELLGLIEVIDDRSTMTGLPLSQGSGSVNDPSAMTSKCRWHPVEYPVEPTRPRPWCTATWSPTRTPMLDRWL